MFTKSVSVIIPCFNDAIYLAGIVREINQSPLTGEIIVVDDGSDIHNQTILKNLKNIILISHPKNLGKARAMSTGLYKSKYPIIVFLDSDQTGFTAANLTSLVLPLYRNRYDLVIGQDNILSLFKASGYATAYSGIRSCRRELLLKFPDVFQSTGYVPGFWVESNLNRHFFNRRYRVGVVSLKNVSHHFKVFKNGPSGLLKDVKIMWSICRHLGLREHLRQIKYARTLPSI